ncbi:MAG: hypothetical protein J6J05_04900, partial [Peptococcaceae bacterium]|nr:hypothetical protein [Peptococcaceae bacterium]
MKYEFGSEWHKWDFHVHTPYSILNNEYGFNPFELDNDEDAFDNYVQQLFTKAVENEIAAIGITDYFMIEGYKRIRNEYLSNPVKMKKLFPDPALRAKVYEIYVFPNIEFRLNTFVGDKSHAINYHVIFSDSLSAEEIEENFLNQIVFEYDASSQRALTLSNIKSLGNTVKRNHSTHGSDIWVGLNHVTVSEREIQKVLNENALFADKFFITIPVDEDLSSVSWDGRDYNTRRTLYQRCHCYMTSNSKTITWALAEGEEQERK